MEEFPDRLSSQVLRIMIPLMSIPIFIMAALGLLVTWKRRKKELLAVYLVIGFIMGQNLVFYSNMRFRAPLEPFLVLLTGGALWWLKSGVNWVRFRREKKMSLCYTWGRGIWKDEQEKRSRNL